MLRFLLWRLLALLAVLAASVLLVWFLDGGLGSVLRAGAAGRATSLVDPNARAPFSRVAGAPSVGTSVWDAALALAERSRPFAIVACALGLIVWLTRWRARRRRSYVRLRVDAYRADTPTAEAVVAMYEALHKRLLCRWWRRLLWGQHSLALEVHHTPATADARRSVWFAVSCPAGLEAMVESALQSAYPNCRLRPNTGAAMQSPVVLRLKKHAEFIKRSRVLDRLVHERDPPMNGLLTVMGACGERACVQLAMTPAPAVFERVARELFKRHEVHLARQRREHLVARDRSMVDDVELRGGLQVQHRPLFFADLRVVGPARNVCERIASQLRIGGGENRLVERGTVVRHGVFDAYDRRVVRGEGNPVPSFLKGVYGPNELAALWHLPSTDYMTVPLERSALPVAPAPPAIMRPQDGGDAARRLWTRIDTRAAAQAEHRRSGDGRAGQVQLSGGDDRRGSDT